MKVRALANNNITEIADEAMEHLSHIYVKATREDIERYGSEEDKKGLLSEKKAKADTAGQPKRGKSQK